MGTLSKIEAALNWWGTPYLAFAVLASSFDLTWWQYIWAVVLMVSILPAKETP